MENIENFNAEQARKLAESKANTELNDVLLEIKDEAVSGKYLLHISKSLREGTISALKSKGFKVTAAPSIATQKENLYYTIEWK